MGTNKLLKAAFDMYLDTDKANTTDLPYKLFWAAGQIDRLTSALREIAECDDIHTRLNQERLCCKFQSIAVQALDMDKKREGGSRKSYSGELELTIDPELHEALALKAAASNQSLNQLINDSIRREVGG